MCAQTHPSCLAGSCARSTVPPQGGTQEGAEPKCVPSGSVERLPGVGPSSSRIACVTSGAGKGGARAKVGCLPRQRRLLGAANQPCHASQTDTQQGVAPATQQSRSAAG